MRKILSCEVSVMNAIGMDENGNLKRREEKHWLMPLPPDEINGNPYIAVSYTHLSAHGCFEMVESSYGCTSLFM